MLDVIFNILTGLIRDALSFLSWLPTLRFAAARQKLLAFLMVVTVAMPAALIFPAMPAAQAQTGGNFVPLVSPGTVAEWSSFCNDLNSVISILQLLNTKIVGIGSVQPAAPTSGTQTTLVGQGQFISNICSLVIAVASATNIQGILNAANILNTMTGNALENNINFFESSMSMYDFLTNLKNSHQSSKEKVLNVNNWSRILNYGFQNFDLNGIDQQRRAAVLAAANDRAQMKEEVTDAIYGCRTPITPLKPGQVTLPDGPTDASTISNWATQMQAWGIQRDSAAQQIQVIQRQLRKMLQVTADTKEQLDSAYTLLDTYTRSAFWVKMGWVPPVLPPQITDGIPVSLPNPTYPYQPPSGSVSPGVPTQQPSIIVYDSSNVFYSDQGSENFSCDLSTQADTQLELWIGGHIDDLANRYYVGKTMAQKVHLCPNESGNLQEALQLPITEFNPPSATPDEIEAFQQNVAIPQLSQNCKLTLVSNLMSDLANLNSIGTARQNEDFPSFLSRQCTPTQKQIDDVTPQTFDPTSNITTYQQFVDNYNTAFNNYKNAHYSVLLEDNLLFNTIKAFAGAADDARMGNLDTSYPTQGIYDPNAGQGVSSAQSTFLNSWRPSTLGLCNMPYHLLQKYPDDADIINFPTKPGNEGKYGEIIGRCIIDEQKTDLDTDLFKTIWMDGLTQQLFLLNQAKKNIFIIDLEIGTYKKSARRKPQSCVDNPRPLDLTRAIAQTSLASVEAQEDAVEQLTTLNDKNAELQKKIEKQEADVEAKYAANIRAIRIQQDANNKLKADPYNNPGYSWGNIAPTHLTLPQQDSYYSNDTLPDPGTINTTPPQN